MSETRIVHRQTIVDNVPRRWAQQYSRADEAADKRAITAALSALEAPLAAEEVDRIIGNKSWTELPCDICGNRRCDVVLRVGDEPDYEARWVDMCPDCAARLGELASSIRSPDTTADRSKL